MLDIPRMPHLPALKIGDTVEIIAPSSRVSSERLEHLRSLLVSWGLHCRVDTAMFGDDLLCANSDPARFEALKRAIACSETKAIICARGGYGAMRLIPDLLTLPRPEKPKLLVGMSDITALHLFFNQKWQWPTVHFGLGEYNLSSASITNAKALLFGDIDTIVLEGHALNASAEEPQCMDASIIGGNLSLIQASIGTQWQLNGANQFVFIEELKERGYRLDRMLEHLYQATLFNQVKAIIFGDFLECLEPNGSSLAAPILKRFAKRLRIPVIQVDGVGHGLINTPLPLGTKATLTLGRGVTLRCFR